MGAQLDRPTARRASLRKAGILVRSASASADFDHRSWLTSFHGVDGKWIVACGYFSTSRLSVQLASPDCP
jgi:hypothetical protein